MSASAAVASKPSLTLQRRYDAPPARVFAAWTKTEKIVGWFGSSDAEQGSVKAEADVRVGGHFTFSFRRSNGEQFRASGIYKEVVPDQKLVFSWAWYTTPERVSQVTVVTKADGGGTLLTLTHEQFFDEAARDAHNGGWTRMLDRLDALL